MEAQAIGAVAAALLTLLFGGLYAAARANYPFACVVKQTADDGSPQPFLYIHNGHTRTIWLAGTKNNADGIDKDFSVAILPNEVHRFFLLREGSVLKGDLKNQVFKIRPAMIWWSWPPWRLKSKIVTNAPALKPDALIDHPRRPKRPKDGTK